MPKDKVTSFVSVTWAKGKNDKDISKGSSPNPSNLAGVSQSSSLVVGPKPMKIHPPIGLEGLNFDSIHSMPSLINLKQKFSATGHPYD